MHFSLLLVCLSNLVLVLGQDCGMVRRDDWGARPATIEYAIFPTKFVIIHHTATPNCDTSENCISIVKSIQNYHMEDLLYDDIGYNFLIGGDGKVYEGTGFHKVGAHALGYNRISLGIAFIGNYSDKKPRKIELQAAQNFLNCALNLGELMGNYTLLGARQVMQSQSPGLALFKEIRTWPHFSVKVSQQ